MQKIIVTGGAGYIGSHTCIELIEQGYQVIILDDLSNSTKDSLARIQKICGTMPEFHQVDVSDTAAMSTVMDSLGDVNGIIHFAAKKAVGESVQIPLAYYRSNILGLINVLTEMKRCAISNLIFSSSCTVYGQPAELPAHELTPIQPAESPYGNTKQIGEEIIRDTISASSGKIRGIALRYFNPIGAHPSGNIGELPLGVPNNLMPFITQTAIGIRAELKVYGDDYETIDGTAVRDYIHVVDIAKAHVKALARLINDEQKDHYEVFNLGTGRGSSVLEVIKSFERTSDTKLPYKIVDRRAGDIEAVYASTKKANEVLGWKAIHDLDDMTRSAWLWEQSLRK